MEGDAAKASTAPGRDPAIKIDRPLIGLADLSISKLNDSNGHTAAVNVSTMSLRGRGRLHTFVQRRAHQDLAGLPQPH